MRLLRLRGADTEKTKQAAQSTRRGLFGRMTSLFRGSDAGEELWERVEEILISADVGVESTMELVDELRSRRVSTSEEAFDTLRRGMIEMLRVDGAERLLDVDETPLALLVVGVNGVGKTTNIAKLSNLYTRQGMKVIVGAGDTYRAAAAEQLQAWGRRLGVDVIAHQAGADPAAVAFDAVTAAKSRRADVVIIDTAGRLHTKTNLMEELKKIRRVVGQQAPKSSVRVLLALDAAVGQNGLYQARAFTEALQCHGVILSKLDGTAKGGIVFAVTKELGLPVLYVGTGEQPDDIAAFDPPAFVSALFEAT